MGFKFLVYSRAFRSVALIFMTLGTPLYLALLGISIIHIGLVYVGVVSFAAILSISLGVLGDRIGYRKSLLLGEIPPLVGAILLALTDNVGIIIIAVIVAGISGLAGGLRGAFSPGMTALVASNYQDKQVRIRKLATLMAVASLSSVFGAILLLSQSYLLQYFGELGAFKILFSVAAVLILISFLSILFVGENERPRKSTRIMKPESFKHMLRISYLNILNGAGLGIAFPLLPLMFALAFHLPSNVTALYIGIIYLPSFIATGIGSYLSNRRHGSIYAARTASRVRITSGVLLGVLAIIMAIQYYGAPSYALPLLTAASIVFAARALVAGFGASSVSAMSVMNVHGEDYGTATSMQGLFGNLSQASSGLSGFLMEFMLPAPLIAGAILQVINGIMYSKLFTHDGAMKTSQHKGGNPTLGKREESAPASKQSEMQEKERLNPQ